MKIKTATKTMVLGLVVRVRVTMRKVTNGWDALFQVVRMYENSASVARILMIVELHSSAVADHVKADKRPRFSWYMIEALYAV